MAVIASTAWLQLHCASVVVFPVCACVRLVQLHTSGPVTCSHEALSVNNNFVIRSLMCLIPTPVTEYASLLLVGTPITGRHAGA